MKTKIIIRKKTLYEQIKELFPPKQYGPLQVEIKHDKITITFGVELNTGQIQKITNLLEKRQNMVVEVVE